MNVLIGVGVFLIISVVFSIVLGKGIKYGMKGDDENN